jgi:hypothetical protein
LSGIWIERRVAWLVRTIGVAAVGSGPKVRCKDLELRELHIRDTHVIRDMEGRGVAVVGLGASILN